MPQTHSIRPITPKYALAGVKEIWLTFDDGPHVRNTKKVLSVLAAHELTATPQIESTLMTVKKPLLVARTWRAETKGTKPRRSSRLSSSGSSAASTASRKTTPVASAPNRTSSWLRM